MRLGRGRGARGSFRRLTPLGGLVLSLLVAAIGLSQAGRLAADEAWIAGDLGQAMTLYRHRLESNPADTRAIHRVALMLCWKEKYDEGLSLFDRLLELEPENVEAALDRARVLAWMGDTQGAVSALQALLVGADCQARREIQLEQAKFLGWASRFEEAETIYHDLLARDPQDVGAHVGLARTRAWDGRLVAAEVDYREAVRIDPDDVEALVGLAQTLRWQGRNAAALDPLSRAADLGPGRKDVREQLGWVRALVRPQVRSSFVTESDSDGNGVTTTTLEGVWHPTPRVRVRGSVGQRNAILDLGDRPEARIRGFDLELRSQFEPGWNVIASLGENGTGSLLASPARLGLQVVSPGRNRFGGTLRLQRGALESTATLIRNPVSFKDLGLDIWSGPIAGWRLQAGASWTVFDGSRSNRRVAAFCSSSRKLPHGLQCGIRLRTFSFEEDLHDGYWDPDRYRMVELPVGWISERDHWSLGLHLAPGLEQQRSDAKASGTTRGHAELTLRLCPGREMVVSWGYASTGQSALGDVSGRYRYRSFTSSATWTF